MSEPRRWTIRCSEPECEDVRCLLSSTAEGLAATHERLLPGHKTTVVPPADVLNAMGGLIGKAVGQAASELAEGACVVIGTDPDAHGFLGHETAYGPFASQYEGNLGMDALDKMLNDPKVNDGSPITFRVVPLESPS